MNQPLPGFLQGVQPVLDHYGYGAVGALILLESVGAPLPGETVLIAAAVYAGTGRLNPFVLAIVAIIAAVVGDNTGYAVGRLGGHRAVRRFGRYVLLTPERFDKGSQAFHRHGSRIVFVARFIAVLRQVNGLLAGTAHLPWRTFAVFDALGSALWVSLWTTLGYFAGSRLAAWRHDVSADKWYLAGAAVALVAGVAFFVVRRRRRGAGRAEPAAGEPSFDRLPAEAIAEDGGR